MSRPHPRVAAACTLLMAAVAGCSGGTGGSAGVASSASLKVVKIGLIGPLSGQMSSLGLGVQRSVELAVRQANEAQTIPGWSLQMVAKDDESRPDVSRTVAGQLAADDDVAGVVGPLRTDAIRQVQPVLGSAGIVEVAPAGSATDITRGTNASAPRRVSPTFFRTVPNDLAQAAVAANYVADRMKVTKVATIDDGTPYGKGLVDAFSASYGKPGRPIAASISIDSTAASYTAAATQIGKVSPGLVYFGGEYPQAAKLSQYLTAAGVTSPLMSGDGIQEPAYLAAAGKSAEGDLTAVVDTTPGTRAAQRFDSDYRAAGYSEPPAQFGDYAYDAANAIIASLKTSLADAGDVRSARQATLDALSKVDFEGATGRVQFDEFGDTRARPVAVYRVVDGKWARVKDKD